MAKKIAASRVKSSDGKELRRLTEESHASLDRVRELRRFGVEEFVYQMYQGLTPADEEMELLEEYLRELNTLRKVLKKFIAVSLGR